MQTLGERSDDREPDRPQPQKVGDTTWKIPWTVTQSIRERVAALPVSTQELLRVAAVVGQRVSAAVLAAGAAQSEMEAVTGLEVACQAALLDRQLRVNHIGEHPEQTVTGHLMGIQPHSIRPRFGP